MQKQFIAQMECLHQQLFKESCETLMEKKIYHDKDYIYLFPLKNLITYNCIIL